MEPLSVSELIRFTGGRERKTHTSERYISDIYIWEIPSWQKKKQNKTTNRCSANDGVEMQYIPKVKSTSGLSDGVQKKQRLFSGEKRPNDTVRSSSRKMQVALIHSTSERKRLPRDGRQDKETRPSSVTYTEAKSSRGKSFLSFFPTKDFGSKCEDRQESELIHGN